MSFVLPPEILDLIVEHLHEDRATLKFCCVVSKSWVARAQRHLFAHVEFTKYFPVKYWVKAFPDPSNSPAHYTRELLICGVSEVIAATTVAHAWIRAFCNIVRLDVETNRWDDTQVSLISLHALSPTLKFLTIFHRSIPSSKVFNLICSFPSLEDLWLVSTGGEQADTSALPSTSPKFTGFLCLVMKEGIRSSVRRLIALPGGLHFTKLLVGCLSEGLESTTSLVSACCNTLESFTIMEHYMGIFSRSTSLGLSAARNLKEVVFQVRNPSVLWIVAALQTVESKNLQQITVVNQGVGPHVVFNAEGLLPEWEDLDRLLVRFWTSHSIRPKLVDRSEHLKGLTPTLFPELTRRGLLDIV